MGILDNLKSYLRTSNDVKRPHLRFYSVEGEPEIPFFYSFLGGMSYAELRKYRRTKRVEKGLLL